MNTAEALLGCILGMILIASFAEEKETWYTIPKTGIGECAIGQDNTLRETKGVATYEVTFKDGKSTEIVCTSNPPQSEK